MDLVLLRGDFEHTFRIPCEEGEDLFSSSVELACENAQVRLLGPRRLSCRCEVAITLTLAGNETVSLYDADRLEAPWVAQKTRIDYTSLAAVNREELSLSDAIRLPRDYPAVEEAADANVTLVPLKVQTVSGGVSFQGLCALHGVTVSPEGEGTWFYQPVEFTSSLSVPDAREGMQASLELLPGPVKLSLEGDETGEEALLQFEVSYTAEASLFREERIPVCTDAFSAAAETQISASPLRLERLLFTSDFLTPVRGEIPWTEGDSHPENALGTLEIRDSFAEGGEIRVGAKLDLRYLVRDGEGKIAAREGSCDLDFTVKPDEFPAFSEEVRVEITGSAVHCDVEPKGAAATVLAELSCRVRAFAVTEREAVSSLREGAPLPQPAKGIVFFYPEKGEGLWEIARRYHVTPETVTSLNDFSDGKIPPVVKLLFT